MRSTALTLLFLAMSLPAFAHHDRDDHGYRHVWKHRRTVVEDCGPRYLMERPLPPPWARRPRVVVSAGRPWCEEEQEIIYAPPPPPRIVRSPLRLWIEF